MELLFTFLQLYLTFNEEKFYALGISVQNQVLNAVNVVCLAVHSTNINYEFQTDACKQE